MFITKQMLRLAFVSTITILLIDLVLGSQVMGQTPGRVESKTITLGIVAEKNQKEIEEHFANSSATWQKSCPRRQQSRER